MTDDDILGPRSGFVLNAAAPAAAREDDAIVDSLWDVSGAIGSLDLVSDLS